MRRRNVLAGVAAATSLAGCLGAGDADGSSSGGAGPADGGREDDDGSAEDAHAATATLAGQPYLGVPPGDAARLVVAFEDPSCPTCRRFHEEVLGDLRTQLIEPESASFVWRPYRYTTSAWRTPAIHAVLAATDRSNSAGWALVEFYHANQSVLDAETVLEDTREFLASETGVDADAVVAAAEERAHASLLEAAEDEGAEAGVTRTPTFVLFEDGAYRTTIAGVQDAALFVAAFES